MFHVVDAKRSTLRKVSQELKQKLTEQPVVIRGAVHMHGLGAGLKEGLLTIEGDAGDYLGVLNDGATIRVTGDVGRYLADNMTRGLVIVEGDAGDGPGQYCYGGTILIQGDAGDLTAVMNKGATIIVAGNVGDDAATYMLAGDLIIVGNAGMNLGNTLIRGSIYVGGEWKSLGHNTLVEEMSTEDIVKLRSLFDEYDIEADPTTFKKITRLSEKPFYKAEEPKGRDILTVTAPVDE